MPGEHAAALVYDATPDVAYEIDYSRGPHLLRSSVGGFTQSSMPPVQTKPSVGFGNVTPRRMLESGPPPKHPWLTVDLAYQELAIGAYQADRVQCAMDTIA